MNGTVNYSVEGARYGISFGTALAIAISYTNSHSVLWAYHPHGFSDERALTATLGTSAFEQ